MSGGFERVGPGSTNRAGSASGLATYPSPWFDPSSATLPPSFKELVRWCSYLFFTNSTINPIIKKKASYAITKLVYEGENKIAVKSWKELLERHLKLPEMEYQYLLDLEVYGNAFASVSYPFDRYLKCPQCQTSQATRTAKWRYRDNRFVAYCPTCDSTTTMEPEDRPVRNRTRVKLIRWYPKYMDIDYNPFSGRAVYVYKIPNHIRKRISDSKNDKNRDIVDSTPLSILNVIKEKANLRLHDDNIYHFKYPSISSEDMAFGMPPILPVFKDVWLYQTYRKAQESIALDHVLPLTLLSPAATSGGVSPHQSIDLASWSTKMQHIVRKWRRDPNGIFAVPFPAQVENIRGDAAALNVHNDITQLQQAIAGGLDVPLEFLQGGLSYCIRADHGLVATSSGLLLPNELAHQEEEGTYPVPTFVEAAGHAPDGGQIKLTHTVGAKKALKITNGLGTETYPSEDHRYWRLNPDTLAGEWVKAKDLAVGDQVGVRRDTDLWGNNMTLETTEAAGKEYAFQGSSTMSHDFAAVAGLIISEGAITGKTQVSVAMHDEERMREYHERISRVLGHELTLETRWATTNWGERQVWTVAAYRKVDRRFLEANLGTGRAAEKRVPKCIRTAPKEYVQTFLRYLYEGDGGCSGIGQVYYTSVSRELIEDVQALLLNMGIVSRIYQYKQEALHLLISGLDIQRFADLIGFAGKRKQELLASELKRREDFQRNNDSERIPYLRERLTTFVQEHRNGLLWEKVHVCPELTQSVYTVPELAEALDTTVHSIYYWIKQGLRAKRPAPVPGRYQAYSITRQDIQDYVSSYGLRRRVKLTVPQWTACHNDFDRIDVDYIARHDVELAKNIDVLRDTGMVWVEIREISEADVYPMVDLTVEDTHSFVLNGHVVHNSGSSISLRILENQFITSKEGLDRFLNEFVVPKMRAYGDLSEIDIHHRDFKMADDAQQKQIALGLRQTNTISDQTTVEELGFDFEDEKERRETEEKVRLDVMERQQLRQAEIQGQVQVLNARYAAMAEAEQQRTAERESQLSKSDGYSGATPDQSAAQQPQDISATGDPQLLDSVADNFLKSNDPLSQQQQLASIEQTNPQLAKAIKQRMKMIQQQQQAYQPLPEQKPPTRANSPV